MKIKYSIGAMVLCGALSGCVLSVGSGRGDYTPTHSSNYQTKTSPIPDTAATKTEVVEWRNDGKKCQALKTTNAYTGNYSGRAPASFTNPICQ